MAEKKKLQREIDKRLGKEIYRMLSDLKEQEGIDLLKSIYSDVEEIKAYDTRNGNPIDFDLNKDDMIKNLYDEIIRTEGECLAFYSSDSDDGQFEEDMNKFLDKKEAKHNIFHATGFYMCILALLSDDILGYMDFDNPLEYIYASLVSYYEHDNPLVGISSDLLTDKIRKFVDNININQDERNNKIIIALGLLNTALDLFEETKGDYIKDKEFANVTAMLLSHSVKEFTDDFNDYLGDFYSNVASKYLDSDEEDCDDSTDSKSNLTNEELKNIIRG